MMSDKKRRFICLVALLLLAVVELGCAVQDGDEAPTAREVKVGVIVDYDRYGGKMARSCIEMALSDFYAPSHHKTKLVVHPRDSKFGIVEAASAALDLIQNEEVEAIIGPHTSAQAGFVVDLGEKSQVPIVSFSATSSSLRLRSSYFFQATQNQTFQARAISSLVQAFRWKQVVAIYVDNEYGQGLIPSLANALQDVGARLSHRVVVPAHTSDIWIVKELYKLMTMQTRVFVVHTDISLGQRIFIKANEIGMMGKGYVWIATNVISNSLSSFNSSIMDSMNGVLGIKTYVPATKAVEEFKARWKKRNESEELNVFGLRAYDAATALAIAVEEAAKSADFSFNRTDRRVISDGKNSTDLEALGVSQNGPSLRNALFDVKFNGMAGSFSLVNGHLPSSEFEIVNIDGENRGKNVGFWTPNATTAWDIGTNPNLLGQIIWPGKSTSVPKGWETPTNRKKLRIGVPEKEGFKGFVDVKHDSVTNNTIVSGFSIDVFKAVIEELPYSVDYEFIPYKISDNTSRNYDELIRQVYLENFDAVVGDITIRENRSKDVDFTLPYTESGVVMVVPQRDDQSKDNAWVFLKPLTWDLWVTTACFFVFIAFVIWALEHRINEEFRGPPSHEIGTSFWFSFSTMVFAHRERVISNSARFVVIIWVYVVLILTQSYTASLTSLLTLQKLQPTVTDVNQLIARRDNVGYIDGSFVRRILIDDLGFDKSQLQVYTTPEECDEKFSKSKAEGGIVAAFDEIPYMKCFLAKYCSKYTMVEPTFKSAGFGFAFPRGSPLVADISRAILIVTEGDTMKQIENKWFEKRSTCPDPNQISSNSLRLDSFWGLFLIVAVASLSALTLHVLMFLYGQRHVLLHSDARVSALDRARIVFRKFSQKDTSSYAFKNSSTGIIESDVRCQRRVEPALTFSAEELEICSVSVSVCTTSFEVSSVADDNNGDISRTP